MRKACPFGAQSDLSAAFLVEFALLLFFRVTNASNATPKLFLGFDKLNFEAHYTFGKTSSEAFSTLFLKSLSIRFLHVPD